MGPLAYKHRKVQRLRLLVGRRTARDAEQRFVIEGTKLLAEALAAGIPVESVFFAPDLVGPGDPLHALIDRAHDAGTRVYELGADVLARVAGTVTPQPVLAVVPEVDVPLDTLEQRNADLVVVCVDVRDPGNAGTVLRSAEAAGAGGVVCCDGSVDVFNPKTVRASAGALFHVPVVRGGDAASVLGQLGLWGLRRLGTSATGGHEYTEVDMTGPVALVLGNEAHGLPDHLHDHIDDHIDGDLIDEWVTIPMVGRSESLNVGMAAAVLCFEAARQRRAAKPAAVQP
jgi:TrmH family RNA methyltransferase